MAHHSPKPFKSTTELRQHEVVVDPFVQWRKGNRAQLVSSVSQSLRLAGAATASSDVSHLTDASVFQVGRSAQVVTVAVESPLTASTPLVKPSSPTTSQAMLYDTAARQERVRRRALQNSPIQIVERFQDIGPCAMPGAVVRMMQEAAENGPLSQRAPPIPDSWKSDRSVTSFDRTKPPSRADAISVGRAMQLMHRIVDDVYTSEEAQGSSGLALSVSCISAESLRSLLPEPKLPGGLSSVLQGLETQWVLEHLSIVDIGFAELIRQVKVQCVERGALLNYVRETLFDYLADFLSSERGREEQIAIKEEELRSASSRFDETCDELAIAKKTILELETEVHRLETLQKYTIAKHIRDKQRLTRRHEHRSEVAGRRKNSVTHSSSDHHDDDDSDEGSDENDDTLAQLVRQKREQEPKVRRASMANPMVVPNSLQHVRQRARIRVAESMDVAVMTDPVFFRTKAFEPDAAKIDTPLPPSPVVRPPRRERLASVSIAKNVSHNYTQTDPPTPAHTMLSRTTSDAVDAAHRSAAAPDSSATALTLEPTAPLSRRPSIMSSMQPRVTTEEIRRRISVAKTKPARLTAVNAGVQATASMFEIGVQNAVSVNSTGTQSSVLLQMHVGGLMQQSVTPIQTSLPEVYSGSTSGTAEDFKLQGNPSNRGQQPMTPGAGSSLLRSRSPSDHTGALSRVKSPLQSRVSPHRTSPVEAVTSPQRQKHVSPTQNNAAGAASKQSKSTPPVATKTPIHPKPASPSTRQVSTLPSPSTTTSSPHLARPPMTTQHTQTTITLHEPLPTAPTAFVQSNAIASKFVETMTGSNTTKTTGGGQKRLAGLVKPLIEGELSSAPSSSVYALGSTKTPGQRFRNLKWMLGSISEVYMSATASKFGPGGDAATLLVKHFRTKYGFEKVADGYAKDFIATLDSMLSASSSATPGGGQQEGGDVSSMGRYPINDDTDTITMHRRIFTYLQFCVLHAGQNCEGLDKDPAFHSKAFLFYLYILDAMRTKGGKGLTKDLSDSTSVRLSPKFILTTLESALKDNLPRAALDLFLLAVQGAMVQEVGSDRGVPTLALPATHPTLQLPDYAELQPFAKPTVPDELNVDATGAWDLDVLLEVLVRGYDTVVRSLSVVGQRTEARLVHESNGPVMTTVVVWNGGPEVATTTQHPSA